jgi:hypothetical protein
MIIALGKKNGPNEKIWGRRKEKTWGMLRQKQMIRTLETRRPWRNKRRANIENPIRKLASPSGATFTLLEIDYGRKLKQNTKEN